MRAAGADNARVDFGGFARDHRVVLAIYTATIFLSALLLFAVQPMFARMVLPRLGGAPAVWAVSMCFFQGVLLCGYCYAHALNRCLEPERAVLTHIAVLAIAGLALPVGLSAHLSDPPARGESLWLIGVLVSGVALPFFALSASAPLLQSWFGRLDHPHSADPYFLYGASNVGSLLALLMYPVVMEPMLALSAQSALWSTGFVGLGLAIALCGGLVAAVRSGVTADGLNTTAAAQTIALSLGWRWRALWVALSFVPSALLVAFTTFVSTDIASAPFLWVVPLAIFLATFTLVFRQTPVISHDALNERQPLFAALAIFATPAAGQMALGIGYVSALLAFVVTCLVCHRELYLRRPAAQHLTEFYLWMSFGGVLGGMFSALLAPRLFDTVIEFPLLLAVSVFLRPQIIDEAGSKSEWRRVVIVMAVGLVLLVGLRELIVTGMIEPMVRLFLVAVVAPLGLLFVYERSARIEIAAVLLMLLAILLIPADGRSTHVVRSFFGVHRVVESADGQFRLLKHGTTIHGARRLIGEKGGTITSLLPATYYYPGGPMARSTGLVRREGGAAPLRFGVVGLGAGAIACSAKSGETWRFFEIDQAVVDIARNPDYFGFLTACRPDNDIVVGDARLTLAKEAPGSFDYLLIDAFSSDSIPTHLLTVEALQLYLGTLTADGVLAFHVSNRHLDLVPVVAANIAAVTGLSAVVVRDEVANPGFDAASSVVVLVSRHAEAVAPALSWSGAGPAVARGTAAWTDDYSNILSALVRGLWK